MSRYDVLAKRPAVKTAETPAVVRPAGAVSRRGNPEYRQFSAFIPLDLYRRLKVRMAEKDLDLGQALEQAISDWLQKSA
jgi:hypothetical protein